MHSPSDCPFCHPKPQRIVAKSPLCLTLLDDFPVSNLTLDFCDFYLARKNADRLVDKTNACMAQVEEFSETDIQLLMLLMPSRKFIQWGFHDYGWGGLGRVRFAGASWKDLSEEEREQLRGMARAQPE